MPVVGPPLYETLHGMKRGMKDLLAPQGMFEDFGLKYVGPVDGHDLAAIETALRQARQFDGPVVVHCVTHKGYGYRPAEDDEADQMHGPGAFDPKTGQAARPAAAANGRASSPTSSSRSPSSATTSSRSPRRCASRPASSRFADRFPNRFYDVGIAEQHAMTSAAGLASAGMHPVVAIYATFLNRAFDQLMMDVALHRLPVTVVLDRAGLTGDDGPSHNGMWDLALLGMVPGIRIAAPRDEPTLRAELREAIAYADGPTVLRYPKTPLGDDIPALRRVVGRRRAGRTDGRRDVDVLVVAIGATRASVLEAAGAVRNAGLHRARRRPPLGDADRSRPARARPPGPARRDRRGRRRRRRGGCAARPGPARGRASMCRPARSACRPDSCRTARSKTFKRVSDSQFSTSAAGLWNGRRASRA